MQLRIQRTYSVTVEIQNRIQKLKLRTVTRIHTYVTNTTSFQNEKSRKKKRRKPSTQKGINKAKTS
jgi:hypothetical protein